MDSILHEIREELRDNADERTRTSAQRFFKQEVKIYGIKSATVGRIAKKYFREVEGSGKEHVFRLCEVLFGSGYMEESFVACTWSYGIRHRFVEGDFATFERWIGAYVGNWATCDTLCNHTVGAYIDKFPDRIVGLKRWAKSRNMWLRRASAVSLIVPAKGGRFLEEAFEISDILLMDKEDLVRKGYGWLLKEGSRTHQAEVFEYVMKNKDRMPRTALRYAIELMPKDLRAKAMGK
ncbi:MAG: DNA alkylation repair protein [Candidatus Altiarchaeota archaeon]